MSLNQVNLQGRITKELEPKYLGNGTAVLNFTIAVDRNFKNRDGERETDFINASAFGKRAETIAQYFNKGEGIIVSGNIQTRTYEDNDGKTVFVTDVQVDSFDFPLQNRNQKQNNNQRPKKQQPKKQQPQQNDPFESNGEVIDISDDLPF